MEGEIESRKHDGEEDPPAADTSDECKGSTGNDERTRAGRVAEGNVPEAGRQEAEGGDEGKEDHDEDEICPECADHVDEAEDSHPQEEETWNPRSALVSATTSSRRPMHTKGIVEFWSIQARTRGWALSGGGLVVRGVVCPCSEEWLQSGTESQPEST